VLADAVNANLSVRGRALVDEINGVKIEKLEDVVRAFDSYTNAYDIVQFVSHHGFECLERAEVSKANSGILKTYGIASDRRL
jgi:uroporphyrinogen-III synthase